MSQQHHNPSGSNTVTVIKATTSDSIRNSKPTNKRPPPIIRPTKSSQLRLEKNNPFHQYSHEQLKGILETKKVSSTVNTTQVTSTSQAAKVNRTVNSTQVANNRQAAKFNRTVNNIQVASNSQAAKSNRTVNNTQVASNSQAAKPNRTVNNTQVASNSQAAKPNRTVNNTQVASNNQAAKPNRTVNTQVASASKATNLSRTTNISKVNTAPNNAPRRSRIDILSRAKPKTQIQQSVQKKSSTILNRPIRRSISAVHLRKLGPAEAQQCIQRTGAVERSHSEDNIAYDNDVLSNLSTIKEETPISSTSKRVLLLTPKTSCRRKSNVFTPIQTPSQWELRDRLSKWLQKRGKSLDSYTHLRCYGVHQSTPYRPRSFKQTIKLEAIDDENKENDESLAEPVPEDWTPKIIDYTNFHIKEDLTENEQITKDALKDLHSLILEKYPQDQCDAWLRALLNKNPNLQKLPEYWECKAALGEINGEFNEVVECYQKAIINGAEVTKIDQSIESLLEKFSILNLDTNKTNDSNVSKQRKKVILDARNVFKSSVIKFAISQREKYKSNPPETSLIATPVRRSTRLSKSFNLVVSPKKKLYDSIKDIEIQNRKSVRFQENVALFE